MDNTGYGMYPAFIKKKNLTAMIPADKFGPYLFYDSDSDGWHCIRLYKRLRVWETRVPFKIYLRILIYWPVMDSIFSFKTQARLPSCLAFDTRCLKTLCQLFICTRMCTTVLRISPYVKFPTSQVTSSTLWLYMRRRRTSQCFETIVY